MKNQVLWAVSVLCLLSIGISVCQAQEVENLAVNGGFETGDQNPMTSYGAATLEVVTELTGAAVPDSPIEGSQCLYVSVSAAGANFWDVGLKYGGYTFEQGKQYTLSAFFKSKSGENNVNFKPELDQDPYTGYGSQEMTFTEEWVEYSVTTPVFTSTVTPGALTFHIGYIAADFWVDGIRFYEGEYVAPSFLGVIAASNPSPASGDTDVARDGTVLSWKPDPMAGTHNVYVGTRFDDVNDAGAANTANVISSLGQDANSLALDRLELGATYYWRVDEVNTTPDKTVFNGKIWSFEVEPEYYTIPGSSITATASSTGIPYATATNTINGSGLNAQGQHSMNVDTMWLSSNTDPDISIQYEFDAVYKLYGMKIWNNNQSMEPFLGVGARDITIETSTDGVEWSVFGDVELARAPGAATYDGAPVIDMNGTAAQYVRLGIHNNWGGILAQSGLSEVQFTYAPIMARYEKPASGSTNVEPDGQLSWRPGREAGQHQVYWGADVDALALAGTVTDPVYDLGSSDPQLGQTYYWRVDEVNDAETPSLWAGPVWSLSTSEFMVVEDFESYTNFSPNRPFQAWFDGYGYSADEFFQTAYNGNGTGAGIGHDIWSPSSPQFDGDIMETENTIAGSGQSMPFYYTNTGGVASKTTHTFAVPQDWTVGGAKTLSIAFNGQTGNTGTLYVMINNVKITYQRDGGNISHGAWQAWNIDLATVNTNLQSITKLEFGVEGSGAVGMILIDDIRLYPTPGELITPSDPGTTGLIAKYTFEDNANDVSGHGNNGTLNGTPAFGTGVKGRALDCDGIEDYVSTGKTASQLGIGGNNPRTVTAWVYTNGFGNGGIYDMGNRADSQDFSLRTLDSIDNRWRIQYWGGADRDFTFHTAGTWVHFTHVHDGARTQVYANGMLVVDYAVTLNTADTNPFQIGRYGWPDAYFFGLIDEVQVYNRALSAGEALWLAGITNPIDKPF